MLSSLGGHYPWVSRIATTAQTLGPVGEGRPRRQCERPGARVEQNLWQAAIRKCSLAPAPPTGRHPKHRGFDNVLGASGGRLAAPGPRKRNWGLQLLKQGPLAPGARPRGPKPTALIRHLGEKGAVEELVGSEGATRAKRGPAARIAATAVLSAFSPGPGATPGLISRSAVRFVEPSPRFFSLEPRLREPRGEPTLSRRASSSSRLLLTPRSSGRSSQWSRDHPRSLLHGHLRFVADTDSRPQPPTPNPSPPHLRRLRQRWTRETLGSSTPALFKPLFG